MRRDLKFIFILLGIIILTIVVASFWEIHTKDDKFELDVQYELYKIRVQREALLRALDGY